MFCGDVLIRAEYQIPLRGEMLKWELPYTNAKVTSQTQNLSLHECQQICEKQALWQMRKNARRPREQNVCIYPDLNTPPTAHSVGRVLLTLLFKDEPLQGEYQLFNVLKTHW